MTNLADDHDESFLMLIDRNGKWHVNTLIKGFATNVQGFASSYSNTGDIILIGKDKKEMLHAFNEIKRIGGGMVTFGKRRDRCYTSASNRRRIICRTDGEIDCTGTRNKEALAERGYKHGDAVYTFLFLQSTHLPYIRITQMGIYDVMKKKVSIPATER